MSDVGMLLIFIVLLGECHCLRGLNRAGKRAYPAILSESVGEAGGIFGFNSLLSLEELDVWDFSSRENSIKTGIIITINVSVFGLIVWKTSRLFSNGLCKKYLKGGGYWLLLSGTLGFLFGGCLGAFLGASAISLAFSFMLLGVSVLLVGRRGMIVGAIAGLEIGITFGGIHSGSISAVITEGVLCGFAGVAIGFVPIFPNLKINSRYIQRSLKLVSLNRRSISSLESQL